MERRVGRRRERGGMEGANLVRDYRVMRVDFRGRYSHW